MQHKAATMKTIFVSYNVNIHVRLRFISFRFVSFHSISICIAFSISVSTAHSTVCALPFICCLYSHKMLFVFVAHPANGHLYGTQPIVCSSRFNLFGCYNITHYSYLNSYNATSLSTANSLSPHSAISCTIFGGIVENFIENYSI